MTLLEKSLEESVRLSLVIAFGDLLFKFPNVVEPWTRFLYARYDYTIYILHINIFFANVELCHGYNIESNTNFHLKTCPLQ